MITLTGLPVKFFLEKIGIHRPRYYSWLKNPDTTGSDKPIPKSNWLLPEEERAIVSFKKNHPTCGYKLLTWMMVDDDVCYTSPSTVLRVLTRHQLNTVWTQKRSLERKKGFKQPTRIHRHWHIDIAYVNVLGTFMFLISVMDGYSRMILSWGLRTKMEEQDVAQVLFDAHEKHPDAKPIVISDNGGQFVSHEYKSMLKAMGLTPRYISPGHPQSNGKLERWHRTVKSDEIRVSTYSGPQNAIKKIGDWIEWYNTKRLHSALNYLPPLAIFEGRKEELLLERKNKLDKGKELRKIKRRQITA